MIVKCVGLFLIKFVELFLVDIDGYVCKVNWRFGKCYMLGVGWKDFVEMYNV